MAEAKGLMKPVKLKNELTELLGAKELPRTEITKKLWDYIKTNKLQTKTENGKPENAGKFIRSLGYHVQTNNRDNFFSSDFSLKNFKMFANRSRQPAKGLRFFS